MHYCQLYETKQDLLDILVPYFVEGLLNNEFCLWVTSAPLEAAEAKQSLSEAIPNLDKYLLSGQLEIISYEKWYLSCDKFDGDRVFQGWVDKETFALNNGFKGLRLTGNVSWLKQSSWSSFIDYEASINSVIDHHNIIALCTYCLLNCTGTNVTDVISNHAGTLMKQAEKWVLIENAAKRRNAEQKIRELARFPSENPNPVMRIAKNGSIQYLNYPAKLLLKNLKASRNVLSELNQIFPEIFHTGETRNIKTNVGQLTFQFTIIPNRRYSYVNIYGLDITNLTKVESDLRKAKEKYETISSITADVVFSCISLEGKAFKIDWMSGLSEKIFGYTKDELIKFIDKFYKNML